MVGKTEVLVVGAGPVGLTLGVELARRGIAARVIDRAAGPSAHPRALVVHCRSQQLLERAGLRESLVAASIPLSGMLFSRGGRVRGRIPFDLGPYPARSLPQVATEILLRDALAARGVEVEWGRELRGISQTDEGVEAEVGGEVVRASHLVGCDGAHSSVRRLLEIPFAGESLPETLWMADARIDWEARPDHVWQFLNGGGVLTAVPAPGGIWRLVTMTHEGAGDPDAAFFHEAVARRAGRAPDRMEVLWTGAFRVNCRQAAGYGRGRVFLAGDAAHIHSPIGGQGMNVGMQDAFELAGLLLEGGDRLLERYQAARYPVAAAVIRANARVSRLAMGRGPLSSLLRDRFMPRILSLPPLARRAGLQVSGLAST